MTVRIGINGFGRIGRLVLRALIENGRDDLVPVAIDDLGPIEANAHLFSYDSVHGRFPGQMAIEGDALTIRLQGRSYGPIRVSAEKDPTKVPFHGVDVAMECTGHFTKKETASQLLTAGARKVLVSAPAAGADATIVYGVNEKTMTRDMTVGSNASCTTNCLGPMVKALHDAFGVLSGYMVTIHSYTGDQHTIDTLHKDSRRARAAALSMIPTSTGAARSGDTGAQGQARWDRHPGADAQRVAGFSRFGSENAGDGAADQRCDEGRQPREASWHSGVQYRAAGQHRLQS